MTVSYKPKYNHAFGQDSEIIQGNNETFEIYISTNDTEATLDDFSVEFDETEFQIINISKYDTSGSFRYEMQCIAEGTHYLMVFSNYDLLV